MDSQAVYWLMGQKISRGLPSLDSEETRRIVRAVKKIIHPDQESSDYAVPNDTAIARAEREARLKSMNCLIG